MTIVVIDKLLIDVVENVDIQKTKQTLINGMQKGVKKKLLLMQISGKRRIKKKEKK